MPPIIEIKDLGKQYKLMQTEPYLSLRDVLTKAGKKIFTGAEKYDSSFWALENINLDINAGERVGIIGRNGAGKSTLLKILSRITYPTKGHINLRGHVASLLEVGTGFHPELTGRENIFLNGAILGLRKKEIQSKLAEIIDFSGVEKFIDTPLKHYSTGMQLRLAFSVAAHLEPEILLIDEVLAVGDAEFQKKCLGKMEDVSKKEGRTILFVSHNMDTIRRFCTTTVLLDEGKVVEKGSTEKVINEYISKHLETKAVSEWTNGIHSYNGEITLHKASLHAENGQVGSRFDTTNSIGVTIEYEVLQNDVQLTHGLNIFNQENVHLLSSHDVTSDLKNQKLKKGFYKATAWLPGNLLPEGIFSVSIAFFLPSPLDIFIHEHNAVSFEIFTDFSKVTARGNYAEDFPGLVRPLLQWSAEKVS